MRLTIARFRPKVNFDDELTCYQVLVIDDSDIEQTFELDFSDIYRKNLHFIRFHAATFTHIMWHIPADWLKISGFLTPLGFDIGEFIEAEGVT